MVEGTPSTAPWVENRPTSGWWPGLEFGKLWRYREVAGFLAWRDVKLRYRQTALGVIWVLLQPFATTALFTGVFGQLVHVPSDGLPYAVFAFAGLTIWNYVSSSVQSGANSLVDARQLVTKLYFPRLLAPLAAVVAGGVDLVVALVGLAILAAAYGTAPGLQVLLLPVWIAAAVAVAFGAGAFLAAVNVRYRDVKYALPFALQLWLFASPVLYPVSLIHGAARWVIAINPLVGLMDGLRWSAVGGPPPVGPDAVSALMGATVLICGVVYFRLTESRLADYI